MVCPLSCLMTYCCYGHEGLISRLSSQLLRCRLHSWEKTAVWSVAFVPLIREIIQYWIISQLVNTESVHLTNKADPFGLLISWNLIILFLSLQNSPTMQFCMDSICIAKSAHGVWACEEAHFVIVHFHQSTHTQIILKHPNTPIVIGLPYFFIRVIRLID